MAGEEMRAGLDLADRNGAVLIDKQSGQSNVMDKAEAKKFAKLLTECATKGDEVPKGWHSVAEIAEQFGKSSANTAKLLRTGVDNGKVARLMFRIRAGSRLYPIAHYRIK